MPLYEYQCLPEGHRFERIQKFSDPLPECSVCGGPVRKLLSSPAIQFKGSGFYITDYAKKSSSDGGKADGSKSEGGKSEGSGSDSSKSETTKAEGSKGESSKSEGSRSEGSKADSSGGKSDSGRSASAPAAKAESKAETKKP